MTSDGFKELVVVGVLPALGEAGKGTRIPPAVVPTPHKPSLPVRWLRFLLRFLGKVQRPL